MPVLITGGAGFIGSTTDRALQDPRRQDDNAGQFTKYALDQGIADTLTWFEERGKILPDLA